MKPVKIAFVLLSNSRNPMPSTRISVLNLFPFLHAANFETKIVFEPDEGTESPDLSGLLPRILSEGCDIVYFQKVHGPSVVELALQLAQRGVKTVYGVCDLVNVTMAEATDATVVVTDYLKSLYPRHLQERVHVVHDGIERPDICKSEWRRGRGSASHPLHAVLVHSSDLRHLPVIGSPPPWLRLDIVGSYPPVGDVWQLLRVARWKLASMRSLSERSTFLRFMFDRRIRRHPWGPDDVYAKIVQADIGIIPLETGVGPKSGQLPPSWMVKSENRLTLKMSASLPVIATPIPSYEPVVEQGRTGFLAGSRREWFEFLEALRDPDLRQTMGLRARESVQERYSMEKQARLMIEILADLVAT